MTWTLSPKIQPKSGPKIGITTELSFTTPSLQIRLIKKIIISESSWYCENPPPVVKMTIPWARLELSRANSTQQQHFSNPTSMLDLTPQSSSMLELKDPVVWCLYLFGRKKKRHASKFRFSFPFCNSSILVRKLATFAIICSKTRYS